MKVAKHVIINQVLIEDIFDFLGNFNNLKMLVHENETTYKSESYKLAIKKLKELGIVENPKDYKFQILVCLNCIKKEFICIKNAVLKGEI